MCQLLFRKFARVVRESSLVSKVFAVKTGLIASVLLLAFGFVFMLEILNGTHLYLLFPCRPFSIT